jgi:RNA polymerase-interacting CarD/CdnL/TRCF family regulator
MAKELVVGQNVVHRRYGAGTVVKVRKGREDEEHQSYYVIDIPSRELKVHLPADPSQKMNLRRLASQRKMVKAMKTLSAEPAELPRDYRERRSLISESLEEGSVTSLASVIRDLVGLKSRKSLSTLESTWLTNAKRRLAGELALVVDIDLTEAMQRLEQALHKPEAE